MGIGFSHYHKKAVLSACLITAGVGLAAFFLGSAVLLLLQLLGVIPLGTLPVLGIGLAPGVLGGILGYLWCRPSLQKTAKQLDDTFHLGEKAQTMLAFQDTTDEMHLLQRENAEETLSQKMQEGASFDKKPLYFLLAAVLLSLACFLGALLPSLSRVPTPEEPEEQPFDVTPWQITAMEALIEQVEQSDLQDPAKPLVLSDLRQLLSSLKTTETIRGMKQAVIDTVLRIDSHIDATNTTDDIAGALASGTGNATVQLQKLILAENPDTFSRGIGELRLYFDGKTLGTDLEVFLGDLSAALAAAPLPQAPLYIALSTFKESLQQVLEHLNGYEELALIMVLDNHFNKLDSDGSAALIVQYTNTQIANSVIRELMRIFALTLEDFPSDKTDDLPEIDTPEGDNDDLVESDGGLGSGETVYGSNDKVYDPDQNTYTEYGKLLNQYHAAIFDMFQNGLLPEELEDVFNDYFGHLSNGSKQESDTENSD